MSHSPGEPPAADSISRNTALAFATTLVSATGTTVLTLFLLRVLGPEDYGVLALALGIGSVIQLPADFGVSHAASRFVAESRADRQAVAGILSDALRVKLAITGGACALLAALAGPVADAYGTSALEWPLRITALVVLGQSLFGMFDQLFEAEGRVGAFVRVVAAESAVETLSSIGLVLAGLGVSGAIAGRAAAYLFASGLALALTVRVLRLRLRLGRGSGNARRLLRYGSALLIVDGAFILFHRIDVLLIGAILSVKDVGQFEAPLRLMTMLGYVGSAVATGVAPRLAAGRDRLDPARLAEALRRLMAVQGLFIAPLVVWAEPITELALGSEYTDSADVLRAITPFMFLLAISPVLARGVNYMGEARRRIPIAIGALTVNLVFDLIFLSEIGIVAGAIGTDIAYALYVLAHLWICKRLIGLELAPLGAGLARVLVAAGGMSAVLLAFGTGEVDVPWLIAGSIAGTAVYAALLVGLREITVAELIALGRRFKPGAG